MVTASAPTASDPDSLKSWDVVGCGVDWLTCSAPQGPAADSLWMVAMLLQEESRCDGYEVKSWGARGFRGQQVAGVVAAARSGSVMVQLSGADAHDHWTRIARLAHNISRCDVQVTVENGGETAPLARLAYEQYTRPTKRHHRPAAARLEVDSKGGSIARFGSRISDRYARLYDKGMESGQAAAGVRWRYEVEFKRDVARRAAGDLLMSGDEHMRAREIVYAHFAGLGLPPPYESVRTWYASKVLKESDAQRKLEWLRRCVGPMVRKLVRVFGEEEVCGALGLTPSLPAVDRQDKP